MTKKTRLIEFDYEKYKAGAKPVFIDLFSDLKNEKILQIFNNSRINDCLVIHTDKDYVNHLHVSNTDLMLEEELEERTFYVAVYQNNIRGYYHTLDNARDDAGTDSIGILKVTFTEEDLIK